MKLNFSIKSHLIRLILRLINIKAFFPVDAKDEEICRRGKRLNGQVLSLTVVVWLVVYPRREVDAADK